MDDVQINLINRSLYGLNPSIRDEGNILYTDGIFF
jgi:hypothetical protein